MERISIPSDLSSIIGSEPIDFSVLARRDNSSKGSTGMLFFAIIWTIFTGFFVVAFFGPLLIHGEVHLKRNGSPVVASWSNFQPLFMPALVLGFFLSIGLALLYFGIAARLKPGGYFVGTSVKLYKYLKGTINTYSWDQFTGNIEMNTTKGSLSLQMTTGRMVSSDKRPDRYVPDFLDIVGIPDVMQVEKICRQRITEAANHTQEA